MGAAECARRTGLTVRALRVYERHGLIDPKRSGKGWRLYGPKELQRLNLIVTLKAFGMTLEQIRSLLQTRPPPLARVLELQLQACRARRAEAEQAVGLVQTALAAVQSGKPLLLEELCDLTRSMEMENHYTHFQIFRGLINEKITPEEERTVMTWIAARPADDMKLIQESAPAMRAVHRSFSDLLEKKVDPTAPETQALVVQLNEIIVRHGIRKLRAAMFEWNIPLAQKWTQMGERALARVTSSSASAATDDDLSAYIHTAKAASPWEQALEPIVNEAAALVDKKAQPTAAPAQALADRLRQICADCSLGDPVLYARWARAMQFRLPAEDTRKQAGWTFLANAIAAAGDPELP